MPAPFIAWGIAALATAAAGYAGKKIYDAFTDDDDDYESSNVQTGPSREEIKKEQREAVYEDLKKEIYTLWMQADWLLCIKDKCATQTCKQIQCMSAVVS